MKAIEKPSIPIPARVIPNELSNPSIFEGPKIKSDIATSKNAKLVRYLLSVISQRYPTIGEPTARAKQPIPKK